MKRKIKYISFVFIAIFCFACEHYLPKPTGYFRIDMKPNEYMPIDRQDLQFEFSISKHSKFTYINKNYYNIYYPDINATIYLTYTKIKNDYYQILKDINKITYKHVVKASSINKKEFNDENKIAVINRLQGDVASNIQFYITDSSDYFFSGSLYFYAIPNYDSLKPCINYVEKDIIHLVESFNEKN